MQIKSNHDVTNKNAQFSTILVSCCCVCETPSAVLLVYNRNSERATKRHLGSPSVQSGTIPYHQKHVHRPRFRKSCWTRDRGCCRWWNLHVPYVTCACLPFFNCCYCFGQPGSAHSCYTSCLQTLMMERDVQFCFGHKQRPFMRIVRVACARLHCVARGEPLPARSCFLVCSRSCIFQTE